MTSDRSELESIITARAAVSPEESAATTRTGEETVVSEQPRPGDKVVNVGDVIEVTTRDSGTIERITDNWIYYRDADGSRYEVSTAAMSSVRVVERSCINPLTGELDG